MGRNDFNSMEKIGEPRTLEGTITSKGNVTVEIFHHKDSRKYYQVQVKEQGDSYRETDPYESESDVKDFGPWKRLS